MFGKRINLFRLYGFEVRIDLSWLILAFLITLTLARGYFPHYHKGLSQTAYWWMGIAGALGLFVSIIFHEFCHSIVARIYGLPIKGITLFIFGGIAEMEDQPQNAKTEFLMAIAGPVSSAFLGFCFYGIQKFDTYNIISIPVSAVIGYLSYINFLLASFNMIPAFPLDGGRILRSALWQWKGNIQWASRIASQSGSAFGIMLIILGVLSVFQGKCIGGIWLFLIGMFLRNLSQMSYQQVLARKAFEGKTVRRFMKSNPVHVTPSLSIEHLIEDYFYKFHFKIFPVIENNNLIGYININDAKHIPREDRNQHTVSEFIQPCSAENTVDISTEALKALNIMKKTGNNKLMVVKNGHLAGVVALKDILHFFSVRMELDQ